MRRQPENAYRHNNKGSLKTHQTVFRLPLAWAAADCTALFIQRWLVLLYYLYYLRLADLYKT